MNKKKSKVLAFLLATAMLVPSANGIVSAADLKVNREVSHVSEEVESVKSAQEDKVKLDSKVRKASGNEASADGVVYSTLKEAFEAGGEVRLLRDVEVNEIINITKDTTLDLGDFTITDNAAKRPFVVEAENFTIKANKGGMVIPESNTGAYGFVEAYVKNFKILGGNYSGNTNNGRLFRINTTNNIKTGTLKVDGIVANTNNEIIGHKGTFSKYSGLITNSELYTDTRAIYFDIIDTTETSTMNIDNVKSVVARGPVIDVSGGNTVLSNNDWTVTGNYEGGYSWARAAVGVGYRANVTIKSGNYIADSGNMKANEGYGVYIYTSGGTVNIEGGNFAGTTASLRADVDKDTYNNPANIIVNNGEFKGDLLAKTNTGIEKITINGGKFTGLTEKTNSEKNNNISVNGGSYNISVEKYINQELEVEAVSPDGMHSYHKDVQDAINQAPAGSVIEDLDNKNNENAEKVILYYNDGTGNKVTIKEDENGNVKLPSMSRSGYNFKGWIDSNTGKIYNADDVLNVKNNPDLVLEAVWEKVQTPSVPSIPSKPIKPTYDHTSIIGSDRYDTAAKIADKLGSYDTAVLVNATSTMSDGLSAAGLAGKEDAAILLVKKDSIPKATMDRLKKVKKVYIIGGENAISKKVSDEITKNVAKVEVERIGGKTRVETSELVAKEIGNYKKAFVVNGFKGEADAMSASSVAAREEAPILLTNGKTSTHAKKSDVKYYVVGGKNVMNNAIADKYNAEIIAGDDRYETNREMVNEFYGASETLYFANGETLVDALTASTIAKDDGLVLVGRKSDNKILNRKNTIQVGGMNFDVDFEK